MLKLVPTTPPSPVQAAVERVKARPRIDGQWQCNRCGGRTALTTENGVMTRNGRKRPGTIIDRDVCSECWKRGIHSQMRPELTVKK